MISQTISRQLLSTIETESVLCILTNHVLLKGLSSKSFDSSSIETHLPAARGVFSFVVMLSDIMLRQEGE